MNRVVLIGNGYDLSCGLPTRYEDFIVNYLKVALKYVLRSRKTYSDELIKVEKGVKVGPVEDLSLINSISSIGYVVESEEISFSPKPKEEIVQETDFLGLPKQIEKKLNEPIRFHITFKSSLFKQLLRDGNWTDIESYYFKQIKGLSSDDKGQEELKSYNADFSQIKIKLRDYIKNVELINTEKIQDINTTNKEGLLSRCTKLEHGELYDPFYERNYSPKSIDKILFINFNYTSVLKSQIEAIERLHGEFPPYHIESIHGSIEEEEDIIFGYGDENQEEYKTLENSEINEYLINIKSFYYALNNKYRKILKFISNEEYDVFCIGHSLGVSDRILLKTIMNNNNCSAIRLFHRGDANSYFRSVISLSRHFEDKSELRKKLIAYDVDDVVGSYTIKEDSDQ